jgi:hypothetical protein
MTPRHRSALLWGAVGALSFLVLHGVYLGLAGAFLGIGPIAGITAAVFATSAVVSYHAESRFGGRQ